MKPRPNGLAHGQKAFQLRLPRELYAAIESRARAEQRSVGAEMVVLMEQALRMAGPADSQPEDGSNLRAFLDSLGGTTPQPASARANPTSRYRSPSGKG